MRQQVPRGLYGTAEKDGPTGTCRKDSVSSEDSPNPVGPSSRSLRYGAASAGLPVSQGDLATLRCGTMEGVTVMGSGQPVDYRDDELDLVDDDDLELDRLDDLCDRDEDWARRLLPPGNA